MNLPTNYDTTGKTYNTLTKTQTAFVHYLYEAGFKTEDDVVFNRSYLTTLANQHGVTWPPAWIVKDTTRCTERGYYAVPELNDYIVIQQEASNVSPGHETEGDSLSDIAPDVSTTTTHVVSDDMGIGHSIMDDMYVTAKVS
jgi:hypothetical protein